MLPKQSLQPPDPSPECIMEVDNLTNNVEPISKSTLDITVEEKALSKDKTTADPRLMTNAGNHSIQTGIPKVTADSSKVMSYKDAAMRNQSKQHVMFDEETNNNLSEDDKEDEDVTVKSNSNHFDLNSLPEIDEKEGPIIVLENKLMKNFTSNGEIVSLQSLWVKILGRSFMYKSKKTVEPSR